MSLIPLLSLALIAVIVHFFYEVRDKRRIRAYLQRRGATQIRVTFHATAFAGRQLFGGTMGRQRIAKRVYKVRYLSAAEVPCQTFCTSKTDYDRVGGGTLEDTDAGYDAFELIPNRK